MVYFTASTARRCSAQQQHSSNSCRSWARWNVRWHSTTSLSQHSVNVGCLHTVWPSVSRHVRSHCTPLLSVGWTHNSTIHRATVFYTTSFYSRQLHLQPSSSICTERLEHANKSIRSNIECIYMQHSRAVELYMQYSQYTYNERIYPG